MDNNHIALASLHGIGYTHKDLKMIFSDSENYEKVWMDLQSGRFLHTPWITEERRHKIIERLPLIAKKAYHHEIEKYCIDIITMHDSRYPTRLRAISQAPYLIYVRGILCEKSIALGIVGSRKSTPYGTKIIESLVPELLIYDTAIISGGAYGIDSIAHKTTINNSGYTIAVFGCGINISYPPQNTQLFEQIIEKGGALLSIFPIDTKPEPYYFPIRNEIIAALSDGILIPEAGEKSGTLITANLALEHGRDVFALPGDIFRETSQGTNMLIASGQAKCVQYASDILEEYLPNTPDSNPHKKKEFDNNEQSMIYDAIGRGYNSPDGIGIITNLTIETIMIHLTLLEIEGHISLTYGGTYEIT